MLKIKQQYNIKLWIEPGRFLVAQAGILIGKITQIKEKSGKRFLGCNIGMSNLIRPMLYNARHPIFNLTAKSDKLIEYCLVGNICESGDILEKHLLFPIDTKINDIIIIANAGAYGYSMSSKYNLQNTKELVINNYIKKLPLNTLDL